MDEQPTSLWRIVLAGLFSTSVLGAVVKGAFDFLTRRAKNKAAQAIETATQVYAVLNDAEYRAKASRIVLTAAHNCGGPIRPDVVLSSTALYEVVSGVEPRLERLANVRLDQWHVSLLARIVKEDFVWIKTSDIPVGNLIRTILTIDGIQETCFFLIRTDGTRILYGAVDFVTTPASNPQADEALRTLQSSLAALLK
jgi:hypothetical protein